MATIIIPRRHYTQPQGRVAVDSAIGICDGLRGLWVFNGANPLNLVTGEPLVSFATSGVAPAGATVRTTSDADYVQLAASALSVLPASSLVSVAIWKRKIDATYRASRFLSDGSNNRFIMQIYSDGQLYFNYGTATQGFTGGTWGDDKLLLVSDGAAVSLYQNGQYRKQTSAGVYSNALGTGLYLGDYNTGDNADRDDFYTLAIWSRALSEVERAEWSSNPWQLFRADPIRIYSLPSGPSIPSWSSLTASNITQTGATLTLGGIVR